MFQAVSEVTGVRSGMFYDEGELEAWIYSNSAKNDFWDVYADGRLVYYFTVK